MINKLEKLDQIMFQQKAKRKLLKLYITKISYIYKNTLYKAKKLVLLQSASQVFQN